METIIWSMDMCSLCEEVKKLFQEKGIEYQEKSCQGLVNGEETNLKAIRCFVKNNYAAPIIWFEGQMYTGEQIKEKFLTCE